MRTLLRRKFLLPEDAGLVREYVDVYTSYPLEVSEKDKQQVQRVISDLENNKQYAMYTSKRIPAVVEPPVFPEQLENKAVDEFRLSMLHEQYLLVREQLEEVMDSKRLREVQEEKLYAILKRVGV
jgi:hypothetical protein